MSTVPPVEGSIIEPQKEKISKAVEETKEEKAPGPSIWEDSKISDGEVHRFHYIKRKGHFAM